MYVNMPHCVTAQRFFSGDDTHYMYVNMPHCATNITPLKTVTLFTKLCTFILLGCALYNGSFSIGTIITCTNIFELVQERFGQAGFLLRHNDVYSIHTQVYTGYPNVFAEYVFYFIELSEKYTCFVLLHESFDFFIIYIYNHFSKEVHFTFTSYGISFLALYLGN